MVFNENLLRNRKLLKDLLRQVDAVNSINGGSIQTSVDVVGSMDNIIIKLSAPTISVESFSILLNYSKLTVSIFSKEEAKVNEYDNIRPLFVPMFMQTFDVPAFIDTGKITAVHENNDLIVTLPFKNATDDLLRMIEIQEM